MKSIIATFTLLILIAPVAGYPQQSKAPFSDRMRLVTNLNSYFERLNREQGFSGAVLIAKGEDILLQKGYGLADDATRTPVTADTIFDVGSITKQFTATAILQLESRGLIKLTDPISKYLDGVPSDQANITIHQLLTHTAGFAHDHGKGDLNPMTRDEALKEIFASPLSHNPGKDYSYSNTGYSVAAAILEKVTGQKYEDYLAQSLFLPAGMTRTCFYRNPILKTLPVAHGYFNGKDQGSPATWPGPYWELVGNGGALSPVHDMYLWKVALKTNMVLPEEERKKLFTPYVREEAGGDSFYGLGWTVRDTTWGGHIIAHNGGGIGGNSDFAWYTDYDLVVIVESNRITYRTLFDVPYDVHLVASEAATQVAKNLFNGNFEPLPEATFTIFTPGKIARALVILVFAVVVPIGGIRYWRRRRSTRRKNARAARPS